MKRSYIEVFFRHRLLLTAPILLAFVLANAYSLHQPRKYSAVVTLFADTAIPNDSTLNTGSGSSTPPATYQQAFLAELLGTRSFLTDVTQHGPDAVSFGRLKPDQQDAALARLASSVNVTSAGPHVLRVTAVDTTPQVRNVANALAKTFIATEGNALSLRAEGQVSYDQQQVDVAGKAVSDAQIGLQQYLSSHPSAAVASPDGVESQLTVTLTQAQQQYSDATERLAKSKAALAHVGDSSALRVVDSADKAYVQARLKRVIVTGVAALMGGLAISLVLIVCLMAVDKSARQETDLRDQLRLQVVGSIAEVTRPLRPGSAKIESTS